MSRYLGMMQVGALLAGLILFSSSVALAKADEEPVRVNKKLLPDKAFSTQLLKQQQQLGVDWSPVNGISYGKDDIIATENPFVSPDKRFSIEVKIVGYEFLFLITDRVTGHTSRFSSASVPVFALEWSPDSSSFLAVEHFAHTSHIELEHWDGNKWNLADIGAFNDDNDDKDGYSFHVVNWEFRHGYIQATYLCDDRRDHPISMSFYLLKFHIDPKTGKTSYFQRAAISADEYAALRTSRN